MDRALQRIHIRHAVSQKRELLQQRPVVIWMTGLPASGKSTLARQLEVSLLERNYLTHWLDGDNLRAGLTSDLGFSEEDQYENIRRSSEVAKLFMESGLITICTFISPTQHQRSLARRIIGATSFLEVYVSCPLEVCVQRDEKNMYSRALRGDVTNLSGVSFPFEAPRNPWIELRTNYYSAEDCINQLLEQLMPHITS